MTPNQNIGKLRTIDPSKISNPEAIILKVLLDHDKEQIDAYMACSIATTRYQKSDTDVYLSAIDCLKHYQMINEIEEACDAIELTDKGRQTITGLLTEEAN